MYKAKPTSAQSASAPSAGTKKSGGGNRPTHSLKVKDGDKFVTLCNLFENVSEKTGEKYFKGRQVDENGNVITAFFIMPINEKKKQ